MTPPAIAPAPGPEAVDVHTHARPEIARVVDVALDLPAAEAQLRSVSFERLILWYHDQYAKRVAERRERWDVERFLHDVVRWYEEGYDRMTLEERAEQRLLSLLFLHNRDLLESAADPVAALRAYLAGRPEEAED